MKFIKSDAEVSQPCRKGGALMTQPFLRQNKKGVANCRTPFIHFSQNIITFE